MIKRKKTKKIKIGTVEIGGNAPISVQSMCNTDTRDTTATINQINQLEDAGCEIVRLAIPDSEAAEALKKIKSKVVIPIIADIHFDYRLAIQVIQNDVDGLRLNPGNISNIENIKKVVKLAKKEEIPIRIGINSGSLEKNFSHRKEDLADSLVESALRQVKIFEDLDFNLIKLSLKSSDTLTMIHAYQQISNIVDYPLHLGVTEAGTLKTGLIKSSIGIGSLLLQGIGDTIRISLTDNPVEEVKAGWEILKTLSLRQRGINFISCPSCGRSQIDLIALAQEVEENLKDVLTPITVAVMGCPVNGPGEAKSADIGIAGGISEGYIFKKGEIIAKVPEQDLLQVFMKEINILLNNLNKKE